MIAQRWRQVDEYVGAFVEESMRRQRLSSVTSRRSGASRRVGDDPGPRAAGQRQALDEEVSVRSSVRILRVCAPVAEVRGAADPVLHGSRPGLRPAEDLLARRSACRPARSSG